MEQITYRITLDTHKSGSQRVLQGFYVGDLLARRLEISLVEGSESYELPFDNLTAQMYIKKPGSSEVSVNVCTFDGNKIIYDLTDDDTDVAGLYEYQLRLVRGLNLAVEKVIVAPKFSIEVWSSNISDGGAQAQTTFTALTIALNQAQYYLNNGAYRVYLDEDNLFIVESSQGTHIYESTVIQDALAQISSVIEYVEIAEAAAESASQSATSASASATSAEASATSASASEVSASASASSASASASSASTDAQTASSSASSATASAASALASAQSASDDADDANASAVISGQNASESEANALKAEGYAVGTQNGVPDTGTYFENNAKYYKENCEEAAELVSDSMGVGDFSLDDEGNLIYQNNRLWEFEVNDDGDLLIRKAVTNE